MLDTRKQVTPMKVKKPYCITGKEPFTEMEQKAILDLSCMLWSNKALGELLGCGSGRIVSFIKRHEPEHFDLKDLSNRARNCILNSNYVERNEFVARIALNPDYVKCIPNCGKETEKEIYNFLEFHP